jgi:hypothetical protein
MRRAPSSDQPHGDNPYMAAANDFLHTFIATQSAYHDHKEQMAYVIAGLYLAGAAWMIAGDHKFSHDLAIARYEQGLLFLLLNGVGWYGVNMFRWQLQGRRAAAVHVAAGYIIAGRWLQHPPTPEELVPQGAGTLAWPTALCQEMARIRHAPSELDRSLKRIEFWTTAVLVGFWLVANLRLLQTVVAG